MNNPMKRISILMLSVFMAGWMACGQEKPKPAPEIEVETEPQEIPIKSGVNDGIDRSDWKVKSYGKRPIQIATTIPLVNTGDRVPENARSYIVRNETWSGRSAEDLQVIVNVLEYQPSVEVNLQAISGFTVEQMKTDVAVSAFKSRDSNITIPGAAAAIRVDGVLFRDGLVHYWFLITAQQGQHIWQVNGIYPETNLTGGGDVEAIIQSLQILQ